MNTQVVYAPEYIPNGRKELFLAGTIEMGFSNDWQSQVIDSMMATNEFVTICNPRRKDWDSSWAQDIEHPQFREQVAWEQKTLDRCKYVLVHFEPKTVSAISLLELGQLSKQSDKKVVVSCPDGYFRQGNVEIVSIMHDMVFTTSLAKAIAYMKLLLRRS